jgi:hypothetical protein
MNGTSATTTPQMFSRDYHVRVPHRRLADIVFEHLCTEQDPSVSGPDVQLCRAGITEWIGRWDGLCVSLGWDWGQLTDGSISLLKAVSPRTNLMTIDAKGYDIPSEQALGDIWTLIESLSWRSEVAAALRARDR